MVHPYTLPFNGFYTCIIRELADSVCIGMKGHTYRVIHFKISPNKYLGASIPSRESHIHTQGHTDGVALGFRMYIQMETRIQALFI